MQRPTQPPLPCMHAAGERVQRIGEKKILIGAVEVSMLEFSNVSLFAFLSSSS